MTPYEWVSCVFSFIALILSIPAFIHSIKSLMRFEIKIENFKSTKRVDGKFINSFDLFIINKNDIHFSISKIFVKKDKQLIEVKRLLGNGSFNLDILPNFNNKIDQFYFITDFKFESKIEFLIITNRRKVSKKLNLDIM